jgi:hypothetical protein
LIFPPNESAFILSVFILQAHYYLLPIIPTSTNFLMTGSLEHSSAFLLVYFLICITYRMFLSVSRCQGRRPQHKKLRRQRQMFLLFWKILNQKRIVPVPPFSWKWRIFPRICQPGLQTNHPSNQDPQFQSFMIWNNAKTPTWQKSEVLQSKMVKWDEANQTRRITSLKGTIKSLHCEMTKQAKTLGWKLTHQIGRWNSECESIVGASNKKHCPTMQRACFIKLHYPGAAQFFMLQHMGNRPAPMHRTTVSIKWECRV